MGLRLGRRLVLALIHNQLNHRRMEVWYVLPAMIAFVLCLGWLGARGNRWDAVFCSASSLLCNGHRESGFAIVNRERQPMRETAALAHAGQPDVLTATFGVSDRQMLFYDPGVYVVKKIAGLKELESRAAAKHIPLVVYVAGTTDSRERVPDLMKRVENKALYQCVAEMPGLEDMFSYRLYQKN